MKTLSLREQILCISLVFILVSALLSYFVLYPLIERNQSKRLELEEVKQEEIKCKNLETTLKVNQEQLEKLDNDIKGHETKFMSSLNTECIEQAIMAKFEENGSPYLDSISVVDGTNENGGAVNMPDGSKSEATLVCKKYTVAYSSTDGICAPHYNHTEDYAIDGSVKKDVINDGVAKMNSGELVPHDGFTQFFETLAQLENNFDCKILVTKFACTSENGYENLTADIEVYSVNSKFRILEIDKNEDFVKWGGSEDITRGGLIYGSVLETDEDSAYYMAVYKDLQVGKRPFAALFSKALFADKLDDLIDVNTGKVKPFSINLS